MIEQALVEACASRERKRQSKMDSKWGSSDLRENAFHDAVGNLKKLADPKHGTGGGRFGRHRQQAAEARNTVAQYKLDKVDRANIINSLYSGVPREDSWKKMIFDLKIAKIGTSFDEKWQSEGGGRGNNAQDQGGLTREVFSCFWRAVMEKESVLLEAESDQHHELDSSAGAQGPPTTGTKPSPLPRCTHTRARARPRARPRAPTHTHTHARAHLHHTHTRTRTRTPTQPVRGSSPRTGLKFAPKQ